MDNHLKKKSSMSIGKKMIPLAPTPQTPKLFAPKLESGSATSFFEANVICDNNHMVLLLHAFLQSIFYYLIE
jgi:hypothetical protein